MIRGWLGKHRCRLGHPGEKRIIPTLFVLTQSIMFLCEWKLVIAAYLRLRSFKRISTVCLCPTRGVPCTLDESIFFLNKTNVQWGERSAFQEQPSDLNIVCVCVHSCFSLQDAVVCLQFSLLSWFKDWRRVLCSASQATPRRSSRWEVWTLKETVPDWQLSMNVGFCLIFTFPFPLLIYLISFWHLFQCRPDSSRFCLRLLHSR